MNSLPDRAYLLPRCPRCGYGLRLVRNYWWCDVCKAPVPSRKEPSLSELFRAAGESLRKLFSPSPRGRAIGTQLRTTATPAERAASMVRCPACGALTPRGLLSCVHCGTKFGQPVEVPRPQTPAPVRSSTHDEIVYRYIVDNGGEISLSKASADLHMSVPELQTAIRRLESSGSILRDGSRETDHTDPS